MTDMRDDFEAHFKPTIRQQKRHMNGDYRDPDIQAKWLGWQAAMGSRTEQKPIMVGDIPVEHMDLTLVCMHLTEETIFDGDGVLAAWNEMVRRLFHA